MKAFQNQEVLVEFDRTTDPVNSWSVVGTVIDTDEIGVTIKRTSDGKKFFIQWPRIVTFSDV